jgi:hypothetical protein
MLWNVVRYRLSRKIQIYQSLSHVNPYRIRLPRPAHHRSEAQEAAFKPVPPVGTCLQLAFIQS